MPTTSDVASDHGVLFVGHGTRATEGVATMAQMAERVGRRLDQVSLELAFLEYARPTIAEGVASLARGGLRRLAVVPVFLTSGRHVRHDVPAEIRDAAARHGIDEVHTTPHLGTHPHLLEILLARWEQAAGPVRDERVKTVLVARGSRDRRAVEEVAQLARRFQAKCPQAEVQTCFFAMSEPRLEPTLASVGRSGSGQVVVVPHLAAPGRLSRQLTSMVARRQESSPHQRWSVSTPLAPDPLLDRAVVDLLAAWLPGR